MLWGSWIAATGRWAAASRLQPGHNKATGGSGTVGTLAGLRNRRQKGLGHRYPPIQAERERPGAQPPGRTVRGSFMSFVCQAVPASRALGQPAVIALALCAGACAPGRSHVTTPPTTAALPPLPRVPVTAKPEQPVFSQTGPASWYRPKLQKRTASGEAFDPAIFTAAHRSLPFGTVVRVTCLKTGKMVMVRINDRGPFTHGRVLDISAAAAEVLGMKQDGEATVLIEEFVSDQTLTKS